MKKEKDPVVFHNYDEYLEHYNAREPNDSAGKSEMFIKGEQIAAAAVRKVMREMEPKKIFSL